MPEQSHHEMVQLAILSNFNQSPAYIKRITIGISNEVYRVGLERGEVIVCLSPHHRFLMGSRDHIPKFKALGIPVPDILAEDFSQELIPLSYQILSKIEGEDLGQVIESLSDQELKNLASEIANIFRKVGTIPASDKFGVIWGGGDNEVSDTWTERMEIWIEESIERGLSTKVMDEEILHITNHLYKRYLSYFASIKPTTYYGDICSKNVMINKGAFSGLVDLDGLTQGDPLEALGRIKLSWYGTCHGNIYLNAIIDQLDLTLEQNEFVTVYASLNMISWTCENGIQFNQNTKAEVDGSKTGEDKKNNKNVSSRAKT